MNEFQYNGTPQEQAMADLLKTQGHRLARQQIIFALIFLLVIVLAAYYIVTRMIWATFDGYITLDENRISAVDDIYILKVNKEMGEVVHKGDTLYSYVLLGNIVNQYDPNILPSAVKETHDMEVQAKLAQQEIPVLRTRLAELRKQKASESSDIYYGLTDNTKRNALDAEIAEVEEELRKQAKKVEIYAQAKNTTYNFMSRRGAGTTNAAMPYSNTSIYNPGLIHYCCAPADAFISKINVSDKTLVFKSEEVMVIQHTDYADCHLGVIAYVPNDMVKYMESPDDADIIINKDLELQAKLQMVGLRVEEIPKHLQSNFSHDANAVVAVFTLNPNQRVPAWVMSNRLPVRIRVNKIGAMLDPKPLPMYTVPVGKNENVKRSVMISSDTNNHQLIRWSRSLVRFRLRKHADILLPTKNWSILNWLSNMESVVFDCFLNFLWLWYIIKLAITFNTHIIEVLALGYFIRVCFSQLAFILVLMVSERKKDVWFLYRYLPLMSPYTGYFLRIARLSAHLQEIFFRRSYKDAWNPEKTSRYAQLEGI
jgi:hypothetical protein